MYSAALPSSPSFPTRRSSDLPLSDLLAASYHLDFLNARSSGARLPGPIKPSGRAMEEPVGRFDWTRQASSARSEEHTSELQSPVQPVFRLPPAKTRNHVSSTK